MGDEVLVNVITRNLAGIVYVIREGPCANHRTSIRSVDNSDLVIQRAQKTVSAVIGIEVVADDRLSGIDGECVGGSAAGAIEGGQRAVCLRQRDCRGNSVGQVAGDSAVL